MTNKKIFRSLLIISILWGFVIFILSSIPGSSLPKAPLIPFFDKIVHAGLYFILASFVIPVFDLARNKLIKNTAALLTVLIASFYGGLIEIAQEKIFINRSGDVYDFLADLAGAFMAVIIYYLLIRKLIHKT